MPIVGIDLGTTNSLIGTIEKGRPRLLADDNGSPLIPSVLLFAESEGAPVVGHRAKAQRSAQAEKVLFSTKRFMGRGRKDLSPVDTDLPLDFTPSDENTIRFAVNGRAVTPVEAGAHVLSHLKTLATKAWGEDVKKAVITVPAYFDDSQRQATKLAGELAGWEVVRILNEPTAACLAYGIDKKTMGTVAVFDLGGGTFDISILRVHEGVFEVLATNGNTALGGDDFDHAISEALLNKAKLPLTSLSDKAAVLVAAEKIKRELSDKETATVEVTLGKQSHSIELTRAELNAAIAPFLERLTGPCEQALVDAKLKPTQITDVILVGGSTRVPAVKAAAQAIFRREPHSTLNPDEVVAMGAAVQANLLSGQSGEMVLLDVIPLSLGIETMGGVVTKILHRNSTVPTAAVEHFSTYVDGQKNVDIHVVQGERELVQDNRSLARFQLRGLPPLPAGVPKIEVEFVVDVNGILSVRASELRTGTNTSVTVNPSFGLNDAEVEKMLMDSFDNAERDFEARFLIEALNEADALKRATEKSVTSHGGLLKPGEREEITTALSRLEKSLEIKDRELVKKRIDELNEVTKPFAERILDNAVSNALKGHELT